MLQRFALALDLLEEPAYYQLHTFDAAHTEAALRYAARFHAAFWENYHPHGTGGAAQLPAATSARLKDALFEPGCWWRKHLRPGVSFNRVPTIFLQLAAAFPESFGAPSAADVVAMEAIAEGVDTITAACQRSRRRTLVHGDFKTSNLFFARHSPTATSAVAIQIPAPSANDVASIDFQWAGSAGSGLGDVVYLIAGGLDAPHLSAHVPALLAAYYTELRERLPKAVVYSWEDCSEDYDWELLDYAKTALPHLLDGLSPALLVKNRRKYGWLTHEYDAAATAWLCREAIRAAQERLLVLAPVSARK